MTHTPGPWRYSESIFLGKFEGEYCITGSNEHGGSILPILGRTHNFPKNAEDNARLIAAAPDLLEALESVKSQFGFANAHRYGCECSGIADVGLDSCGATKRKVLAGIAKARP